MLDDFKILKAMQGIDEEILEDTAKLMGYEDKKSLKHHRNFWRTALIAAVIVSMLVVTAAAVGISIHMKNQEEIRNDYNVDKNNVYSFNQYEVPKEPEGKLTLLSGINDGEFYRLYADYSPITKEEVKRYIVPDKMENGVRFSEFGFRVEGEDGKHPGGIAFFYTKGSEYESEDINENDDVINSSDKETKINRILAQAYDEETETVTLEFHVHPKTLEAGQEYELVLYTLETYGNPEEGLISECREDMARAKFTITEAPAKVLYFPEPVEVTGTRGGEKISFIGCELYPTGIIWYVDYEDGEKIFDREKYNRQKMSKADSDAIFRLEINFINDVEDFERSAFLTLKDGSIKNLTNGNSSDYIDGIIRQKCLWGGTETVNVDEIESISIGGKSILISECTDNKT